MKVVLKGGVWKNTEDEILKAAVMKYGKNQWARISSLLTRKSPKQCKARWFEWLDPSIKKTEWSREEDEKLLHLAKLMPTQWRTIAPIVGRTPNQCLERYQKLLDEAEAKELGGEASGVSVPTADDIRKLRPGEIDPEPESKPARPDPIDMDEDEKEMLAEARARLANTQGKKAKRKARERHLDEAKRLAHIQRRRELKTQGIHVGFNYVRTRKKKKEVDYNADIPFEIKPQPGFYDVTQENEEAPAPADYQTMLKRQGPSRLQTELEHRKKQQEKKKNNQQKEGSHAEIAAKFEKAREEQQLAKRKKLDLPAPQVGETELEELIKFGQNEEMLRSSIQQETTSSSHLIGDFQSSVTARLQTPRFMAPGQTPIHGDVIQTEAKNILALQNTQTPLMGGRNTDLADGGTGFEGLTPQRPAGQTPSLSLSGKTPLHEAGSQYKSDRVSSFGFGQGRTPLPIQDRFGLNQSAIEESFNDQELDDAEAFAIQQQNEITKMLEKGFASLPKPKNDFEIVLPEEEEEAETEEDILEEIEVDRSELEQKQLEALAEEERKRAARRSLTEQRNLPQPTTMPESITFSNETPTLLVEGYRQYIEAEVKGLDDDLSLPDDYLERARNEINNTANQLYEKELKKNPDLLQQFDRQRQELLEHFLLVPKDDDFTAFSTEYIPKPTKQQLQTHLECQIRIAKARVDTKLSKSNQLQKKLQEQHSGYVQEQETLISKIQQVYQQYLKASLDLENYQRLYDQEKNIAMPQRMEKIQQEVRSLLEIEKEQQHQFSQLKAQLLALK